MLGLLFCYELEELLKQDSINLYILKRVNGRMNRRQKIPFMKNGGDMYEKSKCYIRTFIR